jgi:hypothetical protein
MGVSLNYPPAIHDILSAVHEDTLPDTIVNGDLLIGNATPKLSKLPIAIPDVNVRNVLSIDNGELRPSWKASLATPHSLLGGIHDDVLASAVVRGDVIVGNPTPKWSRLPIGLADKFLRSDGTDVNWSSPDGDWIGISNLTPLDTNAWRSVCYGGGKYVAVGYSGTNKIMYSTDGITWTAVITPGDTPENCFWNSICYGTDKFVAVSDDTSDCAMYIYSTSTTKINNHYHTIIVPKSVYASGTPYTLTNISALVDFGTIDPTLTLEETKFYKIRAGIKIEYVGATLAANQVITLKLRKTSGTPADIPNSSTTLTTEILTTITKTMGVFPLPEVVCFLAVSDIIQIWASIDVVPSAGSIQISAASIVAD